MDCKELIEALKTHAFDRDPEISCTPFECGAFNLCERAATAIETILAELDAAVEDLWERPHPSTCKHGEHCDYISAITGFPDCYSCDEWEWRGPQKGDGHEIGRNVFE